MLMAAKWIMSVVPAGIALGALLGGTAAPNMKEAPPPFWRLTGNYTIVPSGEPGYIAAGPEDLSPFGGYRPDLDYDTEVWGSRIAYYELEPLADEPLSPSPEELPTVTYGVTTAAEATADEAEAAAEEAIAAEVPDPAPVEERKPEMVAAGLY